MAAFAGHGQASTTSARPRCHFRSRPLEREAAPVAAEWRPQNEAILLLNLHAFRLMHEGRRGMETTESRGWSIGKFREQVLRAGCGMV